MLLKDAGIWGDSLVMLIIAYGAVIILMFGVMVWRHRAFVASRIRGCITDDCDGTGWFTDLFASIWHLLALAYLFLVWLLWSFRLIVLGPGFDSAFVISLLIVPIYLFIDRAGTWVISAIIGSLQKGQGPVEEKAANGNKISIPPGEDGDKVAFYPAIRRITRIVVILNFMRGGIIVKFNLQFPYDTDIDKVRKTIKKVGQKMLDDPEMGSDFIQPVKSGGVREMGDSVMTIRVKFSAKPGAHFVIRREAFKRITEALEAQGIHYAHRKVIVEVAQTNASTAADPSQQPESDTGSDSAGQSMDQALKAGAAAAVESVLEKKPDKQPQNSQ